MARRASHHQRPCTEVSTPPGAVNDNPPDNRAAPKRGHNAALFTPWGRLIQALQQPDSAERLPLTDSALRVLGQCLWRAGKQGDARDPECRPDEAIFWRELGGLASDTRKSTSSVQRALKELHRAGLVRWKKLKPFESLPSGRTTYHGHAVYYVAIGVIRERLGLAVSVPGTERGGQVNHEESGQVNHELSGQVRPDDAVRETIGQSGDPSSAVVNSVVKILIRNHKHTEPNPAHPSPCGLSSATGDDLLTRVYAHWWDRIGQHRPEATARIQARVRRAVGRAAAFEGITEAMLVDAIDGVSDPQLGGEAHAACEGFGIWEANLFWNDWKGRPCGSIPHLVKAVAEARRLQCENDRRLAARPSSLGKTERTSETRLKPAPPASRATASERGGPGLDTPEQVAAWLALLRTGVTPAEATARVLAEHPTPSKTSPPDSAATA